MAYNSLKALINAYIKQNGVRAITGNILNGVLNNIVAQIGSGYIYKGTAAPDADPGVTDIPVAYVTATAGTYTNFGGLVVASGELAILRYDGTVWAKETVTTLYQIPQGGIPISDLDSSVQNSLGLADSALQPGDINEEDLTIDQTNGLQFADRVYGMNTTGMGYKILRKDATFASQVTDANTIYEIRYDFNLGGATVTIPSGCELYFNGGEIKNGGIVLNNTLLSGDYRFSGLLSLTGTVKNNFLDSETINFASDEREIYYLLRLNVPELKFKKGHTYNLSSPQLSESNAYWLVLTGTELNNRVLDFNGATISFPVSKSFIQYENAHLEGLKISNLNFEGGDSNFPGFIHAYNGASYFIVDNCSFKKVAIAIYVITPNLVNKSEHISINATYEGVGANGTNTNAQCVRIEGVDDFSIDIKVSDYKLARIIGLDGCQNGKINVSVKGLSNNSGAFLFQEYVQVDEYGNNVFSHCRNIEVNASFYGYLFGHIFQFGHYVSTQDPSVAVFANRNKDAHIENIKINIFARDISGEPYWFTFPTTSRQVGPDGKHLAVRFWHDIDANVDIITPNSTTGGIISLTSPITPIDADDDVNFTEMCVNLRMKGTINYPGAVSATLANLDANSTVEFSVKSGSRFDIYCQTLQNSNPNFRFDRCSNFRGVLQSNNYYGSFDFDSTSPNFSDTTLLPNAKKVTVKDIELQTSDIYGLSPFTRYCYKVCASASLSYDIAPVYARCASYDEYTILLKNITGLNRPFTVTDGETSVASTYLVAGMSVILKIGKINGNKYFQILGVTATS